MPEQPINLLDVLGLDTPSSDILPPPPGPGSNVTPPAANVIDLTERQAEKRPLEVGSPPSEQPPSSRQRTDLASSRRSSRSSAPAFWAPVIARPDGAVLSKEDSVSSPDNAFAVAQAVLLPTDMEKEKGSSYDKLLKTGLQSNIKAMQKMFVGLERARDNEKEMKKEAAALQKRAEKAEKDGAYHARLWREANEENDDLKVGLEALKKRSEETELGLRQELEQATAAAVEAYDRGVRATTENYVGQMPLIRSTIWNVCWERCLTVLGIPKDSPHWVNRHLPGQPLVVEQQPQIEQSDLSLPNAFPDADPNKSANANPTLKEDEGDTEMDEEPNAGPKDPSDSIE